MTIEIPMKIVIPGVFVIGGVLLRYILVSIAHRIDRRNEIQKKERLQVEKEAKLQKQTKLEKLLPPVWLTMYDACKTAGNSAARRHWIITLLARKPSLPKISMKAIISFAQLTKEHDGYEEKFEKLIEQMAHQYLELPETNNKITNDCEKYSPKPKKLLNPELALYLKEQLPLQWYKFYEDVVSCPILSPTGVAINRIQYCLHKLRSGEFPRDGRKPEPISPDQVHILANALAMDENGDICKDDATVYIEYLIPFVASPARYEKCGLCASRGSVDAEWTAEA